MKKEVIHFLNHVKEITLKDLKSNDKHLLLRNTIEELGEYANALNVEEKIKNKPLKESARQEAVDLVINALSLFFAEGGNLEELAEYGEIKLKKWEKRVLHK